MSNTALVVIDLQDGLFANNQYPIHDEETLMNNAKTAIEKARNAGVPVIFVQHCEKPGTPGWAGNLREELAPRLEEPVVQKCTPDSFRDTTLHEKLQSRGINHVVILGLQTEYCIDTTCRRAFSFGYKVTLVRDAHSTRNSRVLPAPQIIAHHNAVLGNFCAKLKTAAELEF